MVSISTLENLDCEMPPSVLRQFNAKKDEFQMMPEAAVLALELVKDLSCDLPLLARTIEKDMKLSATILSVANSPLFSPGRPITSVREAIINVGLRQCQSLIQACCAKSLMQSVAVDRVAGDVIMQGCLATAAFASAMNQVVSLGFNGEEFAAGLLHDVGRLLLGSLFPDEFPALHQVQMLDTAESLLDEQAIIGTDHTVMGCYFAIANRLPDSLTEAIRYHHVPEVAICSKELTATTAVADQMASRFLDDKDAVYELAENPHVSAFEGCFGVGKRAQLETNLTNVFELADAIYSSFAHSK